MSSKTREEILADKNLTTLVRDIRPYAEKSIGTLRIDMDDVRSIIAMYDAILALPAFSSGGELEGCLPSPAAPQESSMVVEASQTVAPPDNVSELKADLDWYIQRVGHLKDDLKFCEQHGREQSKEIDQLKGELAAVKLDRVKLTRDIEKWHKAAMDAGVICHVGGYTSQPMRGQRDRYRIALESIAKNTCCKGCQEAALVAKSALRVSDEHPTGEDRNGLSAQHASAQRSWTPDSCFECWTPLPGTKICPTCNPDLPQTEGEGV